MSSGTVGKAKRHVQRHLGGWYLQNNEASQVLTTFAADVTHRKLLRKAKPVVSCKLDGYAERDRQNRRKKLLQRDPTFFRRPKGPVKHSSGFVTRWSKEESKGKRKPPPVRLAPLPVKESKQGQTGPTRSLLDRPKVRAPGGGDAGKAVAVRKPARIVQRRSTLSPLPKSAAKPIYVDEALSDFARQLDDVKHDSKGKSTKRVGVAFNDCSSTIPNEESRNLQSSPKSLSRSAGVARLPSTDSFSSCSTAGGHSYDDGRFESDGDKADDTRAPAPEIEGAGPAVTDKPEAKAEGNPRSPFGSRGSGASGDASKVLEPNTPVPPETIPHSRSFSSGSAAGETDYDDDGFENDDGNADDVGASAAGVHVAGEETEDSVRSPSGSRDSSASTDPSIALQPKGLVPSDTITQSRSFSSASAAGESGYDDEGFESEGPDESGMPRAKRSTDNNSARSFSLKSDGYSVHLPAPTPGGSNYDDSFEMPNDDVRLAIAA